MENILRHFFDFDELVEAVPHGNGHINDTYRVSIRKGKVPTTYLLQRFNKQVFKQPKAVMLNIKLIADHLSNQDYPLEILKTFPSKNGELFHVDKDGEYWRVFNFFENTIAYETVVSPDQAYLAAKAYGQFAKGLRNIDVPALSVTIPGFHDGLNRWSDFETKLSRAKEDRVSIAKPEIATVFENKNLFDKVARLALPIRAIHHDTKINNVLMDKNTGKAVSVIDLDTVMPGIILSDFGDMVRTFSTLADEDEPDIAKVEMRMDIYKALSEGFLSEVGDQISEQEKLALPLAGCWITLMQAVRFLTDFLAGDVYYKTKYPIHNLIRAKNQIALFKSIKNQLLIGY